jgi:hypothetical protein
MYLILLKDNIIQVSEVTPRPFAFAAYGLGALPSLLINYFPSLKFFIFIVYAVSLLLAFVIFYRFAQKKLKTPLIEPDRKGISYLIGAGIFITTCLIGYNWEYRLLFLIFTIPQVISWMDEDKILPRSLLILSIIIIWQSFFVSLVSLFMNDVYYRLISQVFVILLFFGHQYIVLNFLNIF